MSYTRRKVQDGVTVMNKDLYDNLQDGIDEIKEDMSNAISLLWGAINSINNAIPYTIVINDNEQTIDFIDRESNGEEGGSGGESSGADITDVTIEEV